VGSLSLGDELTGFSHHLGADGKSPDQSLVVLAEFEVGWEEVYPLSHCPIANMG